jgi:tetratricopeptide (TPR) repeat protein
LKLLPAEQARLANVRTVNPEAYDAHLRGLQYWYRLSPGDLDSAEKYFELALDKDPNYALAYIGIALVWGARQQMGYAPPKEAGPKAKAATEKAMALDEAVAEGHYELANIKAWIDWDWAGAELEFKRAIEINPSFPDARAYYSHLLMHLKRPQEALPQMERALRLDPFNPLFQSLYAVDLAYVRRNDDAIAQARSAVQTVPDHPVANSALWTLYSRKGMSKEALASAKACMRLYGEPGVDQAFDRGYAQGGYAAAMGLAAEELANLYRKSYANPTDIANLYLEARERAKALEWLEKAFEVRDPNLPYLGLPLYDSLRSEPRYQTLLRRMNLPQ